MSHTSSPWKPVNTTPTAPLRSMWRAMEWRTGRGGAHPGARKYNSSSVMREARPSKYSVRSPSRSAMGLPSSLPASRLSHHGMWELERRLVKQVSRSRSFTRTVLAAESYPVETVLNACIGVSRYRLRKLSWRRPRASATSAR